MKAPFLISLLLLLSSFIFGQDLSTDSRKAIKFFKEATQHYNLRDLDEAKMGFQKAIKADNHFLEAYMLLADVNKSMGNRDEAQEAYQQVIKLDGEKYPEVFFFSGLLFFQSQDYTSSIRQFETFFEKDDAKTPYRNDAEFYAACAKFAQNALKNPVPFKPVNIGEAVNTINDEFINAIAADGLTLFFTGRQNKTRSRAADDDFYVAFRQSDTSSWQPAQKLGPPINTPGNEGALSISPDGRYLFFAGCQWPDGYGSCDIYASQLSGGRADEPFNLGPMINSGDWESQPSLSSDGRTLYFSSTRAGGFGQSDIYRAYLHDDDSWSKPENLGHVINTTGSEMSPFIHPDGQTLYFSSDRHVGMGGIDLFMTQTDSLGNWTEPVNLGYPVNTPGDEINIVVNVAGIRAYISADQFGGYGGYDIFEFDMPPEIRPFPASYMKGVIVDAITKKPLEARFSLIDLDTQKEIVRSFSDKATGTFLVCIPANREYALNVSKENYLFYSENISISGIKTDIKPHLINIALNPIVEGKAIVLRNIFFKSGEFDLQDESLAELNLLCKFLNENPKIKIEISGHTDNIGSESYNLELSENRAKAVFDYLVQSGIASDRLEYRGYGYSKPLAENDSEAHRAQNRRTEVKVLGVGE